MTSWKKPTDDLVRKALESVETDAERHYFFSKLKNPHWIDPLKKRGFFERPPGVKHLQDGYVQYPFWPEMEFLKNVANEASEDVVEVILEIPKTDNPRFYEDIIDIALQVEASVSIKLKARILEYIRGEYHFLHPRFERVLCYWAENDQAESTLELAEALIRFHPDPLATDKQARRKENPEEWTTRLEPRPRFDEWEYQEILEKGVRPLAERESYQAARILIDAVAAMIRLGFHQDELEKVGSYDYSTSWCKRVNEPAGYRESRVNLVNTLTFACEKVYEKAPESMAELEEVLRDQRWDIFRRIRRHLYAKFPNEQTRPWIREMILTHPDYAKWAHHFEFQRMIRLACEHFGADLLTEVERKEIFEAVLSGPSEQDYRDRMGDDFTEEAFEKRKRYFHRTQLRPFASVLFGEYRGYFQKLKAEEENPVKDDDYAPHKSEGPKWIKKRSPKTSDELKEMSDEELLAFLNEWENVGRVPEKWWVEIALEALAEAFQTVFRESIIPDEPRLRFWIENRDRIERPVYVRAMVSAAQKRVKEKQFDRLDEWFDLCEWVLSHPDRPKEEGVDRSDESREHPDWRSSRRAVGEFVETCVNEDGDVPVSARDRLARLLDALCTQYDRELDDDDPSFLDRNDQLSEAFINTRSRSLESLVDFGDWVRRQSGDKHTDATEVFAVLDKRLASAFKHPLTLPEYVILGRCYGNICWMNREWAEQHRSDFFPQKDLQTWAEAFGSFLQNNSPHKLTFDILRSEFEFGIEKIGELKTDSQRDLADKLGEHLFTYYVWEVYPLTGDDSLLERFYEKTRSNKKRWSHLFDHVGRSLKNSGKDLEESLKERIITFFDWRFGVGEPSELANFTFWLKAECLDEKWRLKSYSKILDVCGPEGVHTYSQVKTLRGMLDDHTAMVVECFAKLTGHAVENDRIDQIMSDQAKPILRAGLESEDAAVRENAVRARENLLKGGRFDLLDLDD